MPVMFFFMMISKFCSINGHAAVPIDAELLKIARMCAEKQAVWVSNLHPRGRR